jgi:hypothetical protein
MIDENKLQQRMQRIGDLIGQLDSGEAARSRELLESVMDLHGEALDRVFQRLREAGELGAAVIDSLAADQVVSSVLLLYGLHPLDLETRVRRAIEKLGPTLRTYGAFAELVSVNAAAVRIRFRGVDSAFTARTVKSAMDEELYAAAPDAASVVLLGLEKFAAPDFVPLEMVGLVAAEKA